MPKAPRKGDKTKALYALLWLPDLSKGAACLGSWLVWHANATSGLCNPGQARLIRETGLSERKIRDAKRELEARGIISSRIVSQGSTSFTVHWHALAKTTDDFEALANGGEVVVPPRGIRGLKNIKTEGRGQKNAGEGAENCRQEGQKSAPKLAEGNALKKPVYSVGLVSDKSATEELTISPIGRDGLGREILQTKEDFNFVKLFQRVVVEGGNRLPRTDVSEMIYARLDQASAGYQDAEGDDYRAQSMRYVENFDDFLEPEDAEERQAHG